MEAGTCTTHASLQSAVVHDGFAFVHGHAMRGILSPSMGTVPGTFVARQRPTSTTGLRSSPIPSIVITTSSPAWRVNDSDGTTPVPVMR